MKLPSNPILAAKALQTSLLKIRKTHFKAGSKETVALKYKISPSSLSNYLKILTIDSDVLKKAEHGLLNLSQCIQISSVAKQDQSKVAKWILIEGLSRKDIDKKLNPDKYKRTRHYGNTSDAINRSTYSVDPNIQKFIDQLCEVWGVSILVTKQSDDKHPIHFQLDCYDSELLKDLMFVNALVFEGSRFQIKINVNDSSDKEFSISLSSTGISQLNLHLSKLEQGFKLVSTLRAHRNRNA